MLQCVFQEYVVGTSTGKTNGEIREHLVGTNQLYMSFAGVEKRQKSRREPREKDARRHVTMQQNDAEPIK